MAFSNSEMDNSQAWFNAENDDSPEIEDTPKGIEDDNPLEEEEEEDFIDDNIGEIEDDE